MFKKMHSFIEVNKAHHNKRIQLSVESILNIRLEENPTTGYRWEVNPISKEYLQILNEHFECNENEGIGAGGTRIFSFQPKKTGHCLLLLELKRSWEDSIEEHFQLSITIT